MYLLTFLVKEISLNIWMGHFTKKVKSLDIYLKCTKWKSDCCPVLEPLGHDLAGYDLRGHSSATESFRKLHLIIV